MVVDKLAAVSDQIQGIARTVTEHESLVAEGEATVQQAEARVSQILTAIYDTEARLKGLWVDLDAADAELSVAQKALRERRIALESVRTCQHHAVFALMAEIVVEVRPDLITVPVAPELSSLPEGTLSELVDPAGYQEVVATLDVGGAKSVTSQEGEGSGAAGFGETVALAAEVDPGSEKEILETTVPADVPAVEGEAPGDGLVVEAEISDEAPEGAATERSCADRGVELEAHSGEVITAPTETTGAALIPEESNETLAFKALTVEREIGTACPGVAHEVSVAVEVALVERTELAIRSPLEVASPSSQAVQAGENTPKRLRRLFSRLFGGRRDGRPDVPPKDPVFFIR